jgi:dihydrofolate synthase / folylpolyglutamate synthase
MNYREAVDFIFGHTNYEMVPRVPHSQETYDLRRLFEILERVGNPHLKARSLHITGTNGKGSTAAMLAAVLTKAGYKTGLYTSPHLLTMRERFKIDGEMIAEEELAELTTVLEPEIAAVNAAARYGRLTVFEILTLLSFVWFARQGCEWQVMEVGMGGRFDATNVVQPEVCFLTAIGLDHTEVLGDTLAKIATEKCGIIKPGCAVVSHPQPEEADRVIDRDCREKGVKLLRVGTDVTRQALSHDLEHQEMEIQGRLDRYRVSIPLLGDYQLDNTAAAVAGLELVRERGWKISREDILEGLAGVSFPGRLQLLQRDPPVVVDGGHNPTAAHNLRIALEHYFQPEQSILVVGTSNDKDVAGIARELADYFSRVITTRADNPRSSPPEQVAAEFARYGVAVKTSGSVSEAIKMALASAASGDLICITGSLFVVGEAIAHFAGYGDAAT